MALPRMLRRCPLILEIIRIGMSTSMMWKCRSVLYSSSVALHPSLGPPCPFVLLFTQCAHDDDGGGGDDDDDDDDDDKRNQLSRELMFVH